MREVINNTTNNACVRFIAEGLEAAYPFAKGFGGSVGFAAAAVAYGLAAQNESPSANKQAVTSLSHQESFIPQIEGGGALAGGTLLGVLAVSAVTATLMRTKRALAKTGPEITTLNQTEEQ